jgi:hypothetical protein
MSFSAIGRYTCIQDPSGGWKVSWLEGGQRVVLDCPSLESVIAEWIDKQPPKQFAEAFRLAMTDIDLFFGVVPCANALISALPKRLDLPLECKTNQERFEWHLSGFLQAYNSAFGSRLTPADVMPFLQAFHREYFEAY